MAKEEVKAAPAPGGRSPAAAATRRGRPRSRRAAAPATVSRPNSSPRSSDAVMTGSRDRRSRTIAGPARAGVHRVFVDGRVAGRSPGSVGVDGGPLTVKIGHDGREQAIDVPCGGRVADAVSLRWEGVTVR